MNQNEHYRFANMKFRFSDTWSSLFIMTCFDFLLWGLLGWIPLIQFSSFMRCEKTIQWPVSHSPSEIWGESYKTKQVCDVSRNVRKSAYDTNYTRASCMQMIIHRTITRLLSGDIKQEVRPVCSQDSDSSVWQITARFLPILSSPIQVCSLR